MNILVTPAGGIATTLSEEIGTGTTSFRVASTSGFPATGEILLASGLRQETITYTTITGNTISGITRGTTPRAFSVGANVISLGETADAETTAALEADIAAIEADLPTKASASFTTIAVSGQSDIVADTITDTLTFAAGSNITITTNAATDTVTIAATGGGSGLTQPQVMARTLGC